MNVDDLYSLYTRYPKVITDSRKAWANSIFFALRGDQFDGNNFAAQALSAGCVYAVVDRPEVVVDDRYILVDDTLQTLQELARMHRQKLNIPVIAITGTNGKTTTKELIKCVLSSKYNVFATSGNLNNHIGVPLTLLSIPQRVQIAIIEMGASHEGEIETLCSIAKPTYGLITNIGKAHLEGFGGLEGVKRAKKELYDYLNAHHGVIFFNEENPVLSGILENIHTEKIGYGNPESSICWGKIISASPYLKVELHIDEMSCDMTTRMAGVYNFENLMAAACVGYVFDISFKRITASLAGYTPQNSRSQILRTANNQLLLDYYNANPTSMKESLDNFTGQIQGQKMVILGDMFELGDASYQEHVAIVDLISTHPEMTSIVVGKNFYQAAKDIPGIYAFAEVEELKKWISVHSPKNLFILIKGSRGMKLEQLTELL